MASGGRRPGAGRPKKSAAQKMLEGNPGKRPIEVVDFHADGVELPSEPPSYISSLSIEDPVDDVVSISIEFTGTGALTFNKGSAGTGGSN